MIHQPAIIIIHSLCANCSDCNNDDDKLHFDCTESLLKGQRQLDFLNGDEHRTDHRAFTKNRTNAAGISTNTIESDAAIGML
jgi:hypothetical protein